MKGLLATASILLALSVAPVMAAQPLTDKQMDKVTAGDVSWDFTGAFTLTSAVPSIAPGVVVPGNVISIMGTCSGTCSVSATSFSSSP